MEGAPTKILGEPPYIFVPSTTVGLRDSNGIYWLDLHSFCKIVFLLMRKYIEPRGFGCYVYKEELMYI